MKNMTLKNIAMACRGTYIGSEEAQELEVSGVAIDSRLVEAGFLFVPIRGERVDGHTFIASVFAKGAAAVLSQERLTDAAGPYILVESTKQALKDLASYYRQSLSIQVVGITGSVGKTSTKEMVASVLSQKYKVLKTEGNYNNEIGLPLTIFQIQESHQVAVLEMGISEFGEMHRLAAMANPDICVITNIGLCHLENLGSRDGILKAKTESFAHIREGGIAVLNGDDDKLATISMVNGTHPVFYGIGKEFPVEKMADGLLVPAVKKQVYASDQESFGLEGTKVCIHIGEESFEVFVPLPGEHNVYNALAAASVGSRLGLRADEIKAGIEHAGTISGRVNMLHVNNRLIIDDCYNANPVSMKASLDVLSKAQGRKIAVLGDMGELGEKERELHYEVGEYLAGKEIDMVFTAGKLAKEIAAAASYGKMEIHVYEDRETMTAALLACLKEDDTILVKASHFMEFSKVVAALCEQENVH